MRLSYAQAVKAVQTIRREIAVRNSTNQRLARLSENRSADLQKQ